MSAFAERQRVAPSLQGPQQYSVRLTGLPPDVTEEGVADFCSRYRVRMIRCTLKRPFRDPARGPPIPYDDYFDGENENDDHPEALDDERDLRVNAVIIVETLKDAQDLERYSTANTLEFRGRHIGARIAVPFRDHPEHCIFVHGIDGDCQRQVVRSVFDKLVGKVMEVRMPPPKSKHAKVSAVVQFSCEDDAKLALNKVADPRLNPLGPCATVTKYYPHEIRQKIRPVSICVSGLHPSAIARDLLSICLPFGEVVSCSILCGKSGVSRGIGFVNFRDRESAKRAVEGLNDKTVRVPYSRNVMHLRVTLQQSRGVSRKKDQLEKKGHERCGGSDEAPHDVDLPAAVSTLDLQDRCPDNRPDPGESVSDEESDAAASPEYFPYMRPGQIKWAFDPMPRMPRSRPEPKNVLCERSAPRGRPRVPQTVKSESTGEVESQSDKMLRSRILETVKLVFPFQSAEHWDKIFSIVTEHRSPHVLADGLKSGQIRQWISDAHQLIKNSHE